MRPVDVFLVLGLLNARAHSQSKSLLWKINHQIKIIPRLPLKGFL